MGNIGRFRIIQQEFKGAIQYTINWSPYFLMDKFIINQNIPSEAGIYQLFHKHSHHLEELETEIAFYGGIRGTMREMTDDLSPRVFAHKDKVMKEACFCRFVTCPNRQILNRVLKYLKGSASDETVVEVTEKDHTGLILHATV